jgi:hypothetical protein
VGGRKVVVVVCNWEEEAAGGEGEAGERKKANPRAGRPRGATEPPTDRPRNGACGKPPAPPARWPPRAPTTQQERAQPERASGRTWQWGGCSLACAARRAALYHPNQLCRDVRPPLARHPPSRARRGDPPPPSHFRFRVLARACALCALRACAARRAQRRGAPPLRVARVRASADSHAPRRGGGERGTGTYHPTATEIHVRAYIRVSSWAVRLARCTPPRSCSSASHDRADRAATHLDEAGGRREGAPSLQLQGA